MEKLFDGEYRLMQVLWDSGAVNSTRLVELCQEQLGWNKSTTYTVLRKLKNKGRCAMKTRWPPPAYSG